MMQPLDALGLSEAQLALAKTIYRMVGRRDAGVDFDPAKIPVYIMQPLIGDYVDYLRTLPENTTEEEQRCLDLFNSLLQEAA